MIANDGSSDDFQWPEYDVVINDLHSSLAERSLKREKRNEKAVEKDIQKETVSENGEIVSYFFRNCISFKR